jgi:hypothetical protein
MGPRQTAAKTLRYSTGSRSKAEAGRAPAKTIGTGVCERPRRTGARYGPRPDQRWSGPVGGGWSTAKIGFLDAVATYRGTSPPSATEPKRNATLSRLLHDRAADSSAAPTRSGKLLGRGRAGNGRRVRRAA